MNTTILLCLNEINNNGQGNADLIVGHNFVKVQFRNRPAIFLDKDLKADHMVKQDRRFLRFTIDASIDGSFKHEFFIYEEDENRNMTVAAYRSYTAHLSKESNILLNEVAERM